MSGERRGKWSILEILDWTRGHFESKGVDNARLDAEILLAHVLGLQRVMLYAKFDQPLEGPELEKMRNLVARRARGEPVAYLIGRREFWSLDLEVTPDTLVPRPDTETLVEVALDHKRDAKVIVDVGTGSGAVALALASELKAAKVYATEISEAAHAIAEKNCASLALSERVTILQGSLLEPLGAEVQADLLVANLPYIPSADMQTLMRDVRDFEPHLALDGGPDGLDLIRELLTQAGPKLTPGAFIALEAGADQVPGLPALLTEAGFSDCDFKRDAAGLPRVAYGRWNSEGPAQG